MRRFASVALLPLSALVFVACGGSSGDADTNKTPGGDDDSSSGDDSTGSGSSDGGGNKLPDGGTTPATDSGAAGDASASDDGGGVVDAGPDAPPPPPPPPPPTCTDTQKNGDETDTDCGGTCRVNEGKTCIPGQGCESGADCADGVCVDSICIAAGSNDGVRNGDETDIDCGGVAAGAPRCQVGQGCAVTADCLDVACDGAHCLPPSANDGIKNGTETSVDCGGDDFVNTPRCADALACAGDTDCTSGFCSPVAFVCQTPGSGDGFKNNGETDVDCGGPNAPDCAAGQACLSGSDCLTGACTGNVCAVPPSCNGTTRGGNTCGPGKNEDCCATIAVPGGAFKQQNNNAYQTTVAPYKLDKYEITVGRMRKFIAAKGGNVRAAPPAAGSGAHPLIAGTGWQSNWNDRLPTSTANFTSRVTNGCFGGSDAATWSASAGNNDQKAINCVDWYTLYAFCIWDGGRLPTEAEWGFAGEGGDLQREYAWGAAPETKYFLPGCSSAASCMDPNTYTGTEYTNQAGTTVRMSGGNPVSFGTAPGNYVVHAFCLLNGDRWCFSYDDNIVVGSAANSRHVGIPGQKLDIARWGHHDMTGNLIEWTLDNVDIQPNGSAAPPCSGANCAHTAYRDFKNPGNDPDGFPILGDTSAGGLPTYWRNYGYCNGVGDTTSEGGRACKDIDLDGRYHGDGGRVMRGGSWEIAHTPTVRSRFGNYPLYRAYYASGARCARD